MKEYDLIAKGTCFARSMLLKYKSYKTVYNRIFCSIFKNKIEKIVHVLTEVKPVSPYI